MTDREIAHIQRLLRVRDLVEANKEDFPAGTLGGETFAEIKSCLEELEGHGTSQASGGGASKTSTTGKAEARASIVAQMRRISRTASTMSAAHPGIADSFRVNQGNGDASLLNRARAFIEAATVLQAEFIAHEMPATFLADLAAAIDAFESAANSQNLNRSKRISATAAIKDALARGARAIRTLNSIALNKYEKDPAKLAAWESASHLESPNKTKKATPDAPPTTGKQIASGLEV